ncbi:unnamed protein product [Urochloa humidicola]
MQILSTDWVIMKRLVQFMKMLLLLKENWAKPQICLLCWLSFAYAVLENPNKSRQILSQLDNFNLTHPVLKAVVDLSSDFPEKDMLVREFLDPLVQKYLLSDLNDGGLSTKSERKEISQIYLDFLDNFGDIDSIGVALTRHISLFSEYSPSFKNWSLAPLMQPVRRND